MCGRCKDKTCSRGRPCKGCRSCSFSGYYPRTKVEKERVLKQEMKKEKIRKKKEERKKKK